MVITSFPDCCTIFVKCMFLFMNRAQILFVNYVKLDCHEKPFWTPYPRCRLKSTWRFGLSCLSGLDLNYAAVKIIQHRNFNMTCFVIHFIVIKFAEVKIAKVTWFRLFLQTNFFCFLHHLLCWHLSNSTISICYQRKVI